MSRVELQTNLREVFEVVEYSIGNGQLFDVTGTVSIAEIYSRSADFFLPPPLANDPSVLKYII